MIKCPEPLIIFDGKYSFDKLYYGGILKSVCDLGFNAIRGNFNRTCGEYEKWSGNDLVCKGLVMSNYIYI